MTRRQRLVVFGGVVFLALALVVAVLPATGRGYGSGPCGSALAPTVYGRRSDCAAKLARRRFAAGSLVAAGAIILAAGLLFVDSD